MITFRRSLIAGCFAASMMVIASPAGAVGGVRPDCPGWFDDMAYVVCVGRPGSHVHHGHHHYKH